MSITGSIYAGITISSLTSGAITSSSKLYLGFAHTISSPVVSSDQTSNINLSIVANLTGSVVVPPLPNSVFHASMLAIAFTRVWLPSAVAGYVELFTSSTPTWADCNA